MGWKSTGMPTVRQQRGRWVVRVDGIDTESGRHRPKQLGTYPSRRAARNAAAQATASGRERVERDMVGGLVDRWVESRNDVGPTQLQQYRWAAKHIDAGLGAIPVERLTRDDVAQWLGELARGGDLSRRSIQIVRMTLRAAFASAVEAGDLRRSVAARVPMPRDVAKRAEPKAVEAWDEEQLDRFLTAVAEHRWGGAIRLEALYGLRRSELLALRWNSVDLEVGVVEVVAGLVEADGELWWSEGKSERSRRRIHVDVDTLRALRAHRSGQMEERLRAGEQWEDHDLVVATQVGGPVRPRNFNRTLDRLIARAGVPRLTSHGLRHTAATHMVANASDLGEVRAAAEILGHSPDMLMKTYSHALPESIRTVTTKIGQRSARTRPPRSG